MKTYKKRQAYTLIVAAFVISVVILLFPMTNAVVKALRIHAYTYSYSMPPNFEINDISHLPKAEAVPILMYHGVVVDSELKTNTSRENFIAQMEMLKRNGYKTISIEEYDMFRKGTFTLPPKPIIITFDDGRKDSFYSVDRVLEKLGFKATLFVATIKANTDDPFYLSWNELKKVHATGRFEIEAHGRRSHEEIPIDEFGTLGRYYTSRLYMENQKLESVEEYEKRVEQDYRDGIADLEEHLGIKARYFAIPLSDYGKIDTANYEEARLFNQKLTKKYFDLAFTQIESFKSFYNYKDTDPQQLVRLEVHNRSADELLNLLKQNAHKTIPVVLNDKNEEVFLSYVQLLYGDIAIENGITLISNALRPSARMIIGDRGWKDYSVILRLVREKGRSVSIVAYYKDENNYIILNWGEKFLELLEHENGNVIELASLYPVEVSGEVEVTMHIYGGMVSVYFNGNTVTDGVAISGTRGAVGLGVWDPVDARSSIRRLEVKPLTSHPQIYVPAPESSLIIKGEGEDFENEDIGDTVSISGAQQVNSAVATTTLLLPYLLERHTNTQSFVSAYGIVSREEDGLHIKSDEKHTASLAHLPGSEGWSDYKVNVTLDWFKGTTFDIVARFKDAGNYVACSFSNQSAYARMYIIVEGNEKLLGETPLLPIPDSESWHNVTLGTRVGGQTIACIKDDLAILQYTLTDMSLNGGIGFRTWDKDFGNTDVVITSLSVE